MKKLINGNNVLVISHEDDIDGIGGVILGYLAFKDIDYMLIHVQEQAEIVNLLRNSNYESVFITDLGLENKIADEINELGMNVLHFDHHETNVYASRYAFSTVKIQINGISTCGTELFYLYLKDNNLLKDNTLIKRFVEDTRAYDTWDWVKNNNVEANELNKLFSIIGIDSYISKMVDKLSSNEEFLFDENDKYLIKLNTREENELIELSDKSLIIREKDGFKFGIVFGNKFLSIIGNTLCSRHPELDYMLLIDPLNMKVSLRSTRIDVSKVAESYGGGGHKYAAGFSLNEEKFKSLLKIIINSDKKTFI